MTREEFWMEVYLTSYKAQGMASDAADEAHAAIAAYNDEFKQDAPAWPKGSLPWAIAQMQLGDSFSERLRRKETGAFPNYAFAMNSTHKGLTLIHPCDANALDWEVAP